MLILLGTWAMLVSAIITVGWLLDSGMDANPGAKGQLAQYLAVPITKDLREWLRGTHRIFLDLFDWVYGGSWAWRLEQALWVGLLAAPGMLLGAELADRASGAGGSLATDGLVDALFRLGLLVILGFLWFAKARRLTSGPTNRAWSVRELVVSVAVCFVVGFVVGIFIGIFGGIVAGFVLGIVFGIVFGIVGGMVFGIASGSIKIPINPFRALASSLFFLGVVSFFQKEAAWAFVHAVQANTAVLAFVAFNVFADAFSLLETRWVLKKGESAGIGALSGLVVLDLVASAAIYLVLPTILWPQIKEFWEAWRFQGSQPWLGILFWTTFSTSILFYLFLAAAVVARPLRGLALWFGWMSRLFDLEAHPVRCISVALAVVVTVVFTGVGIAQGISNGAEASLPPVSPGTAWLVPV